MIRWVFLIAMVLPICLGQMAGGFGPDRAPTEDEASILGGAVQQYLLTQGQNSAEPVRIIRVSAQVVSGTNYCVEVQVGDGEHKRVKIFQPLPYTNKPAYVTKWDADC